MKKGLWDRVGVGEGVWVGVLGGVVLVLKLVVLLGVGVEGSPVVVLGEVREVMGGLLSPFGVETGVGSMGRGIVGWGEKDNEGLANMAVSFPLGLLQRARLGR